MKTKRNHRRKRRTFEEYVDILKKRSLNSSERSILVGKTREMMVEAALWHLVHERKKIFEYMPSGKFSKHDVNGIDFILIVPVHGKREKVTISVVGPVSEPYEKLKHPDVDAVIAVDFYKDSITGIASRIEKSLSGVLYA